MSTNIEQILTRHPIVSDQVDVRELRTLLIELGQTLQSQPHGAVVEFGCYVGTTSLFIRRLLDQSGGNHLFHVYDSFAGLPPKHTFDQSVAGDQFVEGELHASRKQLLLHFKKAGLIPPVIHKAWFSDLVPDDVPNQILFAFLDGDYYESIHDSLALVTPKLLPGATIVIDDYVNEALPGAARATDEWAHLHRKTVRVQASLAIIHW